MASTGILAHVVTVGGDGDSTTGGCTPETMRMIIIGTAVLVAFLIIYAVAIAPSMARNIARDLGRQGWVLYTRKGCPACVRQRALLDDFDGLRHVECTQGKNSQQVDGISSPPLKCGDPAIVAYPFWANAITGETRVGYQDMHSLKSMAGC